MTTGDRHKSDISPKGMTMTLLRRSILLLRILPLWLVLTAQPTSAQAEWVPADHRVYTFLERMQRAGLLPEFQRSDLPISRGRVSRFLSQVEGAEGLSSVDRSFLRDFSAEFSEDSSVHGTTQYGFLNDPSILSALDDDRYKHVYHFSDDHSKLTVDGLASYSYRTFHGDRFNNTLLLGQIGARLRVTLYENIGFYLRLSNGQSLEGNDADRRVATQFDPVLSSNENFFVEKKNNYDTFEGYLRFQSTDEWISAVIGREQLLNGTGYLDRMFLSSNSVPFDFVKLNVQHRAVQYTFLYGSLFGDSLGAPITSKNIVSHRLSVNLPTLKIGIFEAVILSDRSLSFTYMNPVSFLVSADMSTSQINSSNTFLGCDVEWFPFRDLSLQGTLIIDDMNFGTMSRKDSTSNDNKFGFQFGAQWQDPFGLRNLALTAEYTRLGPFVYSHRSNKSTYTHWNNSLGHALPPNSDEIAVRASYDYSSRLGIRLTQAMQRSATGLRFDPVTKKLIANYGGTLLRGDGDYLIYSQFLKGDRYDTDRTTAEVRFEPIRQYLFTLKYQSITIRDLVAQKTTKDAIITFGGELDF